MMLGGFIQAMINSLKANARPKRNIFVKSKNKLLTADTLKNPIAKKNISPAELKKVISRIKLKASVYNRKQKLFRLLFMGLFAIVFLFIGVKLYENIRLSQQETARQYEKAQQEAYESRQKLIIEGYAAIKSGNFVWARMKFFYAAKIDPDDYRLQLGLVICNVKLCKAKRVYCTEARDGLQKLRAEYGNLPEVEKISREFNGIFAEK